MIPDTKICKEIKRKIILRWKLKRLKKKCLEKKGHLFKDKWRK
jgi:hypothetical protein